MPRQPYLPTFQHLNYVVGALVLKDRPDHCAAIGKCIALWGQVDNELGNLFGLLLGAESAAALEVFLSLRRFRNQREALQSAAKHKLEGEVLQTFQAILAVYGSLEKERNCLAHGCFGISNDDPTVLFWVEVKDHVHFQTEVLAKEFRGEFDVIDDRHARLKESMYVYRLSDLEALYMQMEEFWWATFYFNCYLRRPDNAVHLRDVRQYPQIAAALLDLASRSKRS